MSHPDHAILTATDTCGRNGIVHVWYCPVFTPPPDKHRCECGQVEWGAWLAQKRDEAARIAVLRPYTTSTRATSLDAERRRGNPLCA